MSTVYLDLLLPLGREQEAIDRAEDLDITIEIERGCEIDVVNARITGLMESIRLYIHETTDEDDEILESVVRVCSICERRPPCCGEFCASCELDLRADMEVDARRSAEDYHFDLAARGKGDAIRRDFPDAVRPLAAEHLRHERGSLT